MASQSLPNPAGSEPSGTYGGSGIGVSGASEPQKRAYDAGNAFVAMTRQTNLAAMLNKADRTVYLIGEAVKGLSEKTDADRAIKTQISEGLETSKETLGLIKNNSLYKGTTAMTGGVNSADIDIAISEMLAFNFDKNMWGRIPPSPTENTPIKKFVRTVVLRDLLRFKAGVGSKIPTQLSPGQGALDKIYAMHSTYLLDCKLGLTSNPNLRIPRYAELDSCIATTYSIMFPESPQVPINDKDTRYNAVQSLRKNRDGIKQLIITEFPGLAPGGGGGNAAAGGGPEYKGTFAVRDLPEIGGNSSASSLNLSSLSSSSSASNLTAPFSGGNSSASSSSSDAYPGLGVPLPPLSSSTSSAAAPSSSPPGPQVDEYYKVVQGSGIAMQVKNVFKIKINNGSMVTFFNKTVNNSAPAASQQLPTATFMQNISTPDAKGYQFVKMTAEEIENFKRDNTDENMRGGARKTRNRKMNRRRKTGKRSKPSPLQLS